MTMEIFGVLNKMNTSDECHRFTIMTEWNDGSGSEEYERETKNESE